MLINTVISDVAWFYPKQPKIPSTYPLKAIFYKVQLHLKTFYVGFDEWACNNW